MGVQPMHTQSGCASSSVPQRLNKLEHTQRLTTLIAIQQTTLTQGMIPLAEMPSTPTIRQSTLTPTLRLLQLSMMIWSNALQLLFARQLVVEHNLHEKQEIFETISLL